MPEGDTVFRTAAMLHRALAGQRLSAVDLRVPALATVDLTDWTVIGSASRGKHLLLRLQPPGPSGAAGAPGPSGTGHPTTLHSHLGMDGSWRVYRTGASWRAPTSHQVRAVLRTESVAAVGSQLRELTLLPTAEEATLLADLGPDLLDPAFDPTDAVRRLTGHQAATIGDALRDQRNLAGIGNLCVRPSRGALPPVRHPDPARRPGWAGELLVPHLPAPPAGCYGRVIC